jgi:hypothetical protein
MTSVKERFGMTDALVARLNSNKTKFVSGDTICIAPRWGFAVDRTGARVCEEPGEVPSLLNGLEPVVDAMDRHVVE